MDWRTILGWLITFLVVVVIGATILSAIESNRWWMRVWDFPRLAVLALGLLLCGVMLAAPIPGRTLIAPFIGIAMAFQFWSIFPYTPLASVQARTAQLSDDARRRDCITILSINVYMHNREFDRTLALIEEIQPDVLFLIEVDDRWAEAMRPALDRYETRFNAPLSNEYGKILATNLRVESGHIVNLTHAGTPSVHAVLETRGGNRFRLAAIHPRPPLPGEDTEARDAELVMTARMVDTSDLPAVVFGDFNDVGWSQASRLARSIGGYVDPRIGRGFYATFPASWPALRWPLDHIFFTEKFTLSEIRVERNVGSDHLPLYAEICLSPELGGMLNEPEQSDEDDVAAMERTIETYRETEIYKSD